MASVSVETCPECGASLPPDQLDPHLRGEHRLYRFRGIPAPVAKTEPEPKPTTPVAETKPVTKPEPVAKPETEPRPAPVAKTEPTPRPEPAPKTPCQERQA